MAQWLRKKDALAEETVLVPSIHMLTIVHNSSSRNVFF